MSSWLHQPSAFLRYSVAAVSVAAALAIALLADTLLQGGSPIVSLLFCAIIITVWFGGRGPGLFAIAVSALIFDYYFLAPARTLAISFADMPRLIFFVISALFVVFLGAAHRETASSLQLARNGLEVAGCRSRQAQQRT